MTVTGMRRAGERAVILEVQSDPAAAAAAVHRLAASVGIALMDVVPGAATVLVVAGGSADLVRFTAALPQLVVEDSPASGDDRPLLGLRVRYDGPDLSTVAEATGMDVAEVIRRHSAPTYRAAFTGFAPGFAYLTGLDRQLQLPRRESPRPAVPPGSVAIADTYSAVYPRASPGGWHLIATTEAVIFDSGRAQPALITPGTRVRFIMITRPRD